MLQGMVDLVVGLVLLLLTVSLLLLYRVMVLPLVLWRYCRVRQLRATSWWPCKCAG